MSRLEHITFWNLQDTANCKAPLLRRTWSAPANGPSSSVNAPSNLTIAPHTHTLSWLNPARTPSGFTEAGPPSGASTTGLDAFSSDVHVAQVGIIPSSAFGSMAKAIVHPLLCNKHLVSHGRDSMPHQPLLISDGCAAKPGWRRCSMGHLLETHLALVFRHRCSKVSLRERQSDCCLLHCAVVIYSALLNVEHEATQYTASFCLSVDTMDVICFRVLV